MHDPIPDQTNPETHGTGLVQFFETADGVLPPGTPAAPRPADRPREVPAEVASPAHPFAESEAPREP
jgi:hypothetical protein